MEPNSRVGIKFATAFLYESNLFINSDAELSDQGAFILAGDQRIVLHRASDRGVSPPKVPYQIDINLRLDDVPFLQHGFDGNPTLQKVFAYLNALPDWSLSSGQTLQLQIDGSAAPHLLSLKQIATIPAIDLPLKFEALVAEHRCNAALMVRFEPTNGQEAVTLEEPLHKQFTGGRDAGGYQKVSLDVPFQNTECQVSFHIKYLGGVDEIEGHDPYIFMANPKIIEKVQNLNLTEPKLRSLDQADGGHWYHASVPLFRSANDQPVKLCVAGETVDIFAPETNQVSLVDDYGHTVVVASEAPQPMLVYIDGKPVSALHLSPNATPFRIPEEYLRGEILDVTIRDMSGSQVFLSLPVLAPRMLTPHDIMLRESRAPFPTDLTQRANHRYQALRAHVKEPVAGLEPASLHTALEGLEQSFETIKLKPLSFPTVESPDVSIVVPAHNKVEVTYYCLCALLVAHNKASFEVIVVDDASTDETKTLGKIVSGITVLRNDEAQRFIRACNRGVSEARGKYVVLLNNDTEPTAGWLDNLIDAFDRFENVGAVGSKLLYPDGTLQDAGGIVWGTGNPLNYGHGANPWDPRFSYARQADYLSGAALMTTRDIWDEVGGLSNYLEPMYFEDTDFSFKIRNAGYKTYFVPSSVVYHFEGMTSGTDTSSGFKRYQEENRPKFKRRWAKAYASHSKEGQMPDLEKDRGIVGRVLFVDYASPREDRDAGSYAARREIELVQSLGYKVTFLPHNLAHLGSYTEEMERNGIEMIHAPFYLSLAEFLEKRASEFDAIYITRYYVAQDVIPLIREHAHQARIILNNADLHFLRELRAALSENDPVRLQSVQAVREKELEMMKQADVVLSYNEVEHSVIASHTEGAAKVMTCPWVVETPANCPPRHERHGLSFLGSFNHHPNVEGAKWFCREVMPLLEDTGSLLTLYGSGMKPEIKSLASEHIIPAGFIEDIADAYDKHLVFTAPLLSGAGIKGKVLSAIAHGIPTVLTPVAAEGIGLRSGYDCIVAETPQEWNRAIRTLLSDVELWENMSLAARNYAANRFSFEKGREKMKAAFEAVDLFNAS